MSYYQIVCKYYFRLRIVSREFFTVDVINMLYDEDIPFIVPAVKTKGVKKAIKEFRKGKRDVVSRHCITSLDNVAEFTLIILKKENYEGDKKDDRDIFVLVTSASVGEVLAFRSGEEEGAKAFAEQYRARWGVKTAYRDYESSRPRTTSKNESIRILLLFLPIFLYNAWNLARYLLQAAGYDVSMTFKKTLKLLLEFIRNPYDQIAFVT